MFGILNNTLQQFYYQQNYWIIFTYKTMVYKYIKDVHKILTFALKNYRTLSRYI
jgi:hypothetical protein